MEAISENEPVVMAPTEMSGTRKAAILLTAVGLDIASRVLKSLPERELERVSGEIARLKNVRNDDIERVLVEYRDILIAKNFLAEGGPEFAEKALQAALGEQRAEDIMFKIQASSETSAFHLMQTIDTGRIAEFLKNEHPQTIAFILANLSSRKAAEIAGELSDEQQQEAFYRLAKLGELSPEMVSEFEEIVREQLGPVINSTASVSGGVQKVADILNSVTRSAERVIMEAIIARDSTLADNIKDLMFVFDDLIKAGDKDLQRLLAQVDQKDLVVAMKGAANALQERILANVSERAAAVIGEELELMGPVRVSDVEEAQRNILDVAKGLEEKGEISLTHQEEQLLE
jgi:flagellar motor switch protein FliG